MSMSAVPHRRRLCTLHKQWAHRWMMASALPTSTVSTSPWPTRRSCSAATASSTAAASAASSSSLNQEAPRRSFVGDFYVDLRKLQEDSRDLNIKPPSDPDRIRGKFCSPGVNGDIPEIVSIEERTAKGEFLVEEKLEEALKDRHSAAGRQRLGALMDRTSQQQIAFDNEEFFGEAMKRRQEHLKGIGPSSMVAEVDPERENQEVPFSMETFSALHRMACIRMQLSGLRPPKPNPVGSAASGGGGTSKLSLGEQEQYRRNRLAQNNPQLVDLDANWDHDAEDSSPVVLTVTQLKDMLVELRELGQRIPETLPLDRLALSLQACQQADRSPRSVEELATLFTFGWKKKLPIFTQRDVFFRLLDNKDLDIFEKRPKRKPVLIDFVSAEPDIEWQLLTAMVYFKLWDEGSDAIYKEGDFGIQRCFQQLKYILTSYAPGHSVALRDATELALLLKRKDLLKEVWGWVSPEALEGSAVTLLAASGVGGVEEAVASATTGASTASSYEGAAPTASMHSDGTSASEAEQQQGAHDRLHDILSDPVDATKLEEISSDGREARAKWFYKQEASVREQLNTLASVAAKAEAEAMGGGAADHQDEPLNQHPSPHSQGKQQQQGKAGVSAVKSPGAIQRMVKSTSESMSYTLKQQIISSVADCILKTTARLVAAGGPGQGSASKAMIEILKSTITVMDEESAGRVGFAVYQLCEQLLSVTEHETAKQFGRDEWATPEAMHFAVTTMMRTLATTKLAAALDKTGVLDFYSTMLLYVSLRQQGRFSESFLVAENLIEQYDTRGHEIRETIRQAPSFGGTPWHQQENVIGFEKRFRMIFFQFTFDRAIEDTRGYGQKVIQEAIERFPQAGEGWRMLAQSLYKCNKIDDAVVASLHASRLNPLDASSHMLSAELLRKAKRYEESAGYMMLSDRCDEILRIHGPNVTVEQLLLEAQKEELRHQQFVSGGGGRGEAKRFLASPESDYIPPEERSAGTAGGLRLREVTVTESDDAPAALEGDVANSTSAQGDDAAVMSRPTSALASVVSSAGPGEMVPDDEAMVPAPYSSSSGPLTAAPSTTYPITTPFAEGGTEIVSSNKYRELLLLLKIDPTAAYNALSHPWKAEIERMGNASEAAHLFVNEAAKKEVQKNADKEGSDEIYNDDALNTEYIHRMEQSHRYSKFDFVQRRTDFVELKGHVLAGLKDKDKMVNIYKEESKHLPPSRFELDDLATEAEQRISSEKLSAFLRKQNVEALPLYIGREDTQKGFYVEVPAEAAGRGARAQLPPSTPTPPS